MFAKDDYIRAIDEVEPIYYIGRVERVVGLVIESSGPPVPVGELCRLRSPGDGGLGEAEVVGFREGRILLMPIGSMRGLTPGSRIVSLGGAARVKVGPGLLGRVIDGLGDPIDQGGPIEVQDNYPLYSRPGNPLTRSRIKKPVDVGLRAVNALLTIGQGQRIGIFAGSGVGKSTLLGMIARHMRADINVIALIGERGREVREFIEKDLGQEGMKHSVVIAATSEQPALVRMRGAYFEISGRGLLMALFISPRMYRRPSRAWSRACLRISSLIPPILMSI